MILTCINIFYYSLSLGLFFILYGEKIIPKAAIAVKPGSRFYPATQHLRFQTFDLRSKIPFMKVRTGPFSFAVLRGLSPGVQRVLAGCTDRNPEGTGAVFLPQFQEAHRGFRCDRGTNSNT